MQIETALAVAHEAEAGENIELVALAPSDLLAAQTNLVNWCDGKVKAIRAEVKDLRENLRIAKESKWRTNGLASALSRAEKRIPFYEKIKMAVAAGYLIVPNFPVDVFAMRVSKAAPKSQSTEPGWGSASIAVEAEHLPAGEGRYVGPEASLTETSYEKRLENGKTEVVRRFETDGFIEEIGFPVQAVRPIVLDATQRALALKIFDSVGVVRNGGAGGWVQRRGDPIVVGRVIDPRGNGRMVTFFVAWWLNTADL
jgi:hypothetical protein